MTKVELVTVKEDWYDLLLLDLKKMEFTGVVITRWNQGKRILQDDLKFKRAEYGDKTVERLASDLGMPRSELFACVQFARVYPELSIIDGQFAGLSWRDIRIGLLPHHTNNDTPPFPPGAFSVIYADPPWEYDFSQSDSRSIETKYPTMSLEELIGLKDKPNFPNKPDASLFLWATAPKLEEALELIDGWGFTYRTNAVWDKEKIGMGYWFRGQHEHLLLGVKGDVAPPAEGERVASVIRLSRTEHSRKPSLIPELIERWFPGQEWIELFARGKVREGWTGWGLDAK